MNMPEATGSRPTIWYLHRRCALEGSVESLDEHPFHAALSEFDRVSCQLFCSKPLQPLLDRNYNVVEGGAFDIVVVEIKAAE